MNGTALLAMTLGFLLVPALLLVLAVQTLLAMNGKVVLPLLRVQRRDGQREALILVRMVAPELTMSQPRFSVSPEITSFAPTRRTV